MRRLATAALCFFGAIAMAACTASENASGNKSTLEGKGYTVSLYSAEEYKTLSIAQTLTEPKGLSNHLVAMKVEGKNTLSLAVWYFDNFDHAEAWKEENISVLGRFYSPDNSTGLGMRNNAIWAGSTVTVDVLGWRTID